MKKRKEKKIERKKEKKISSKGSHEKELVK